MRAAPLLLLLFGVGHAQPVGSPAEAVDLEPDPDVLHVRLVADERAADGFAFAYNGQVPGPTLRAQIGDMLVVELSNRLDVPTTIHWHGVKVPWAMDGVTWMMDPVMPGEVFTYSFPLEHAGTFWYHPHFDTAGQVDAGLYGMLVVEDPGQPTPDDEHVLVFDTASEHPGFAPGMDRPAHGRASLNPRWLVNGRAAPAALEVDAGAHRVRLLNASNVQVLALSWPGLRQIAGGQGLLPAPQSPPLLVLAPGMRAEVEWSVGEAGFTVSRAPWSLNGGRTWAEPEPLFEVRVDDPAPAPALVDWGFDGAEPSPDATHVDIVYAFAGSDRSGRWLINGERFPDITIETIPLGQEAIVEVRNLSPTEHPFHLHGLSFEVLSVNGTPPPYRVIEDTWHLAIRDRVRLRVLADNPGDWMAHCHILPHAEEGMMTVLRVE